MRSLGLILLVVWGSLHCASQAVAHSFDLNRQRITTFAEILVDLRQSRAVFVGELHGEAGHHSAQLQVIRALREGGAELSIGLEMFRQDGQDALDRWVRGELDEFEFGEIFQQHWSNWHAYREIFSYARAEKIPLVGLNISRDIVSQVAREGFASLSDAQRAQLPIAACNVSPQYRDFIRRALHGHGDNESDFEHFCEAQMLWDAGMAKHLEDHLRRHPQRLVVVLAGNGHSWKHGIPEQISRLGSYRTRVLLPEVPGRIDLGHIGSDDADYLLQGVDEPPLH